MTKLPCCCCLLVSSMRDRVSISSLSLPFRCSTWVQLGILKFGFYIIFSIVWIVSVVRKSKSDWNDYYDTTVF